MRFSLHFLRTITPNSWGKRATGTDFFRVFHDNTAADITDLLVKYFQNSY